MFMPIDWAAVSWVNVGLLSAFAFLATLIGGVLSFNNRLFGAIPAMGENRARRLEFADWLLSHSPSE
jgi:hypothetical protein